MLILFFIITQKQKWKKKAKSTPSIYAYLSFFSFSFLSFFSLFYLLFHSFHSNFSTLFTNFKVTYLIAFKHILLFASLIWVIWLKCYVRQGCFCCHLQWIQNGSKKWKILSNWFLIWLLNEHSQLFKTCLHKCRFGLFYPRFNQNFVRKESISQKKYISRFETREKHKMRLCVFVFASVCFCVFLCVILWFTPLGW